MEIASFLQSGVVIDVAAVDVDKRPVMASACGCRVSPARDEVTVFVSEMRANALLRVLKTMTSAFAAVFCEPASHRTLQLKAYAPAVVALTGADAALIVGQREMLAGRLFALGSPQPFVYSYFASNERPWCGIRCRIDEIYDQTPGPGAGRSLGSAA